jgi:hypothetical protein
LAKALGKRNELREHGKDGGPVSLDRREHKFMQLAVEAEVIGCHKRRSQIILIVTSLRYSSDLPVLQSCLHGRDHPITLPQACPGVLPT